MRDEAPRLRLLTRPNCHLCEDMARDLSRLQLTFATIDIEMEPDLEAAYGNAVPVLMAGDAEIARAPHTEASLTRALMRAGLLPGRSRETR
jgi:glutaredoxin